MPKFRITNDKTGQSIVISGDKPPTKEQADKIFETVQPPSQELGSPLMQMLASAQTGLAESEALPVTGGILGGILGGPAGAAGGAGGGEAFQQILQKQVAGRTGEELIPTGEDVAGVAKTAATAGVLDFLGGKIVSKTANLVKGVYKNVDDAFKSLYEPIVERVNKRIITQTLSPASSRIAKDMTEEGISKTLEAASKRPELIGKSAQEIWQIDQQAIRKIGGEIGDFVANNTDDLPKIDMSKVAASLDSEIARLKDLGRTDPLALKQAEKLIEMQDNIKIMGEVPFEEAWNTTKTWGQEVANYYDSGKIVADIKPYKAKAFTRLNNETRKIMKETAKDAGFEEWATLADEYSFWKKLEPFAKSGAARSQTAVSLTAPSIQKRILEPGIMQSIGGMTSATGDVIGATGQVVQSASDPLMKTLLQGGFLPQVSE